MIDLTIVIPSYETRDLLLACLESVEAARRAHPGLSVETIVVDNGSTDGSVAAVAQSFPGTLIVAMVRNRGFAAAVNRGIALRQGRAVLLLNSDAAIDTDLLADGIRLLDGNPKVGVVGAALRYPDGRVQRTVHPLPGIQTELVPDFILRLFRPAGFSSRPPQRGTAMQPRFRSVEAVRGAAFLIRGELLDEVGSFDEGFFFFLEETDFCDRVHRAGYEVVLAEDLCAVHEIGSSSKRRARLATRIEFHRSLYRYLENARGRRVAAIARAIRMLRGTLLVLLLVIAYPMAPRFRRDLSERWGLLLWHLQGCPEEPGLADVLVAQEGSPQTRTPWTLPADSAKEA